MDITSIEKELIDKLINERENFMYFVKEQKKVDTLLQKEKLSEYFASREWCATDLAFVLFVLFDNGTITAEEVKIVTKCAPKFYENNSIEGQLQDLIEIGAFDVSLEKGLSATTESNQTDDDFFKKYCDDNVENLYDFFIYQITMLMTEDIYIEKDCYKTII